MGGAVPSGRQGPPLGLHCPLGPGICVPGARHPYSMYSLFPASPACPFGPSGSGPYWFSPSPYMAKPCPTLTSWLPPPPPPPAAPTGPPKPPPPPSHPFGGSDDYPELPVAGNRVKGQLATFPDKSVGYIFPRRNVTIHLFAENVILRHPPENNVVTAHHAKFNVQHAPCDMNVEELIEQLDCRKRANHHPPYNQPGHGYPEHGIGVQELLEWDRGKFILGDRIMLNDARAKCKLGDLWSEATGNAGEVKPIYLVRLPV